jgi:hypothetical protein
MRKLLLGLGLAFVVGLGGGFFSATRTASAQLGPTCPGTENSPACVRCLGTQCRWACAGGLYCIKRDGVCSVAEPGRCRTF